MAVKTQWYHNELWNTKIMHVFCLLLADSGSQQQLVHLNQRSTVPVMTKTVPYQYTSPRYGKPIFYDRRNSSAAWYIQTSEALFLWSPDLSQARSLGNYACVQPINSGLRLAWRHRRAQRAYASMGGWGRARGPKFQGFLSVEHSTDTLVILPFFNKTIETLKQCPSLYFSERRRREGKSSSRLVRRSGQIRRVYTDFTSRLLCSCPKL